MTTPGALADWKSLSKVRFQIRVEDFADDEPGSDEVIPGTGSESFGLGQEHQTGGQFKSVGFDIVPESVTIERNSYRRANEAKVTILRSRLPINPQVIRAATIQIFGGVMDPVSWSEAMQTDSFGVMLPDARIDGESQEVFAGFVDDWSETISDRDTIEVSARDLTQFFVDPELPQNALRDIPKTTKLDDVIRLMLFGDGLPEGTSRRPGLPGVRGVVVTNETGSDLPKLSQIKPPNWFNSKKTVAKARKRAKKNVQKMSYWDMMTDLAVSAGFIIYVRAGTKPIVLPSGKVVPPSPEVVINNPRTYYGKSASFGDQIVSEATIRQFIVGVNVSELQTRRNYAGTALPSVVEVRSFDSATGKEFSARFPAKKKANRPSVSGKGDREEAQVFIIRSAGGDQIQETLDAVARSIYEQLGRGEIEVTCETPWVQAMPHIVNPQEFPQPASGGLVPPELDADMFRLQSGDPVAIIVDKADFDTGRVSQVTLLNAASPSAQEETMIRAGMRQDLAAQIAEANTSQWIQKEFRLQQLGMEWAKDRGWRFKITAINYLDVRNATENG